MPLTGIAFVPFSTAWVSVLPLPGAPPGKPARAAKTLLLNGGSARLPGSGSSLIPALLPFGIAESTPPRMSLSRWTAPKSVSTQPVKPNVPRAISFSSLLLPHEYVSKPVYDWLMRL